MREGPKQPLIRPVRQEPRIGDLIPKTGLFPQYVARASKLTDAPLVYHIGALLGALSAVLAPYARYYVHDGTRERRSTLHLWLVLCGDPDNRKSHAVDMAVEMTEPWLSSRTYRASGSKQGLEEVLMREPYTFFPIREAPQFLADNRAVWMRNGSAFWCEVFDGQMRQRLLTTKDGGRPTDADGNPIDQTKVHTVCATMLLAGATEGLVEQTKRTDWTAGFMSRMMFLHAGRGRERDDWYDWSDEDKRRIRSSISKIVGLVEQSGDITRSAGAGEVYKTWFDEISGGLDGLALGVRSLLSRLRRHVTVVSALYALSCGRRVISTDDMAAAISFGRYSHRSVLGLPVKIR